MNASDMNTLKKLIHFYSNLLDHRFCGLLSLDFYPLLENQIAMDLLKCSQQEFLQTKFNEHIYIPDEATRIKTLELYTSVVEKQTKGDTLAWFFSKNNIFRPPWKTEIFPIINPDSGNIICLEVKFNPIKLNSSFVNKEVIIAPNLLQLLASQRAYRLTLSYNPCGLSIREHEILFLLCHDFRDKEITYILNTLSEKSLATATIRNTINANLFSKLSVVNRVQLKNIATKYKYDIQIPVLFIIPNKAITNVTVDPT